MALVGVCQVMGDTRKNNMQIIDLLHNKITKAKTAKFSRHQTIINNLQIMENIQT